VTVAGSRPRPAARPSAGGWAARLALVALVAVLAPAGFLAGRGAGSSLALLVASASSGGNVLASGTWALPVTWYLHNQPTPPNGPTVATEPLQMDDASPTVTTLYNYDLGVDAAPGRAIARGGSGPRETAIGSYVGWRSQKLTAARRIAGNVMVALWTATMNFRGGRTGSLTVYLRDVDAATGGAVEIGQTTLTVPNWQRGSSTWVLMVFDLAVAGVVVPAGHVIELKVEAGTASATTMWVAYDTTGYASSLTLP
jgi:hypothetical protein